MAARLPSAKPHVGEQRNQNLFRTALATVTGSLVINTKLATKGPRNRLKSATPTFAVISLLFEDAGGTAAEEGQRLSSVNNNDGTFTIYVEKTDDGAAWIPATVAQNIRWTIMITG